MGREERAERATHGRAKKSRGGSQHGSRKKDSRPPKSSRHSIARFLPAHPALEVTLDFAYIAPYAHSIPKSPKRIARNLSNAHCAQYAKQPIARYMHFGQNNIARNAQNAYSAVYAFWPKSIARYMHFGQKRIARNLQKPTKTRHRRAICTCSCQLL